MGFLPFVVAWTQSFRALSRKWAFFPTGDIHHATMYSCSCLLVIFNYMFIFEIEVSNMPRSSALADPTMWFLGHSIGPACYPSLVSPFNNQRNSAELSDDCPSAEDFSCLTILADPILWNFLKPHHTISMPAKKQSTAGAEYKEWEGKWKSESGRWRGYIYGFGLKSEHSTAEITATVHMEGSREDEKHTKTELNNTPQSQRQGLSHCKYTYICTLPGMTMVEYTYWKWSEHRETVSYRQYGLEKTGFTPSKRCFQLGVL